MIVTIMPKGGGPTGQSGFFLLPIGGEVTFKAEVSGTLNPGVTWKRDMGRGSIQPDPADNNKVKYIAPPDFNFTNETSIIKATSVENPGAFEDAIIQLTQFVESRGQTLPLDEDEIIVGGLAVSPSQTIDFNDDANIDMVSRNFDAGTVTINIVDPFDPSGVLTFCGKTVLVSKPVSLVVGDFVNDLDPDPFLADVAGLSQNPAGNEIVFISGNKTELKFPCLYVPSIVKKLPISTTETPQLLASGRFHNPPQANLFTPVSDLAIGTLEGSIIIFLQDRNPEPHDSVSFVHAQTVNLGVGGALKQLFAGDFNGDGLKEIAIVREDDSDLIILRGDQTGDFSGPRIIIPFPAPIASLISDDFNGDGISDLIAAHTMPNQLSVFLGNGTGGFTDAGMIPLTFLPGKMATGDLNIGGNIDVAVTDMGANVIHIFFGDGSGQFIGEWRSEPVSSSPRSLIFGAFSGFPSTVGFQNADLIYIEPESPTTPQRLHVLNNKNF